MNKERRERLEEIHRRLLEIAGEIEEIAGKRHTTTSPTEYGIVNEDRK